MKKVINTLVNILKGLKYPNTPQSEEEHYLIVSSNTDPQGFYSNSSLNEEAALNNLLSNSNVRRAPSSYNY